MEILRFVSMHPWGIEYHLEISIRTRLVLLGEQREDVEASGVSPVPQLPRNEAMRTNKAGAYNLTQGRID